MKIGILTQPLQNNYGALLQNYALQQILIRQGHFVETLDWSKNSDFDDSKYRLKIAFKSLFHPGKYQNTGYIPTRKENAVILRAQNDFVRKYIKCTKKLHSPKDFARQDAALRYDAYVVGSDQCWRPIFNPFLPTMFLDFVKDRDVKRLAYAASFGTSKWEFSDGQTELCRPLAQKFDMVTVREDSGVSLCRDYLGVDAIQVLDPTLLLSKEDYINLIESENTPESSGTLFYHILDPDEKISAFISRVEQSQGLKSFRVLPKYQVETRTRYDVKNHIEDCVFPAVTTWIRAFMDAEITIVDSFHGMVFSIIFNKPFWVIGNEGRGMSRFTSLLKVFHLEDRLLDPDSLDDTDIMKPVDWEPVNRTLQQKREESISLLIDALSNPQKIT